MMTNVKNNFNIFSMNKARLNIGARLQGLLCKATCQLYVNMGLQSITSFDVRGNLWLNFKTEKWVKYLLMCPSLGNLYVAYWMMYKQLYYYCIYTDIYSFYKINAITLNQHGSFFPYIIKWTQKFNWLTLQYFTSYNQTSIHHFNVEQCVEFTFIPYENIFFKRSRLNITL